MNDLQVEAMRRQTLKDFPELKNRKEPFEIKVKTATGNMNKFGDGFRSYSESDTCPSTCPLKKSGCYAESGPTSWQWKKVDQGKGTITWSEFLQQVRRLQSGNIWRHNIAGDLPHTDGNIAPDALRSLTRANKGKRGYTYTHHTLTPHNLSEVRQANKDGFTVNLSANGMHQVDQYVDTGLPVVTVLPIDAPKVQKTAKGRKVVVCPAVTRPDKVTCVTCGICANPDRDYVIGFPAHGVSKKKAQMVALSEVK